MAPFQLVLEGVRARQLQDALLMDNRRMEKEIQRANSSLNFFNIKVTRIEDQVYLKFLVRHRDTFTVLVLSCEYFPAVEILLRPGPETCRR